nr:cytochrome c oxidase accessory protein CcoG [Pseudomonas sp.]
LEHRVEGERSKRMRRDAGPKNFDWLWRKLTKHSVWMVVSLWTGFTFVGYFTPIRTLGYEVFTASLGPWQTFWIFFYGLATYGNAGWLREKVCKYMCPYARFQGVMFDDDTLTVTYDVARGEPRGSRARQATKEEHGLGDCINCTLCVQVCPTGIDIRNGLQYECINCGACVDACDDVMAKMGYEPGLIRYGTGTGLSLSKTPRQFLARLKRPRVVVYTVLLAVLSGLFLAGVWTHEPLRAEVLRDRTVMARPLDDGGIENLYRVHVTNSASEPIAVTLSVAGLPGIALPADEQQATIRAQGSTTLVLHAQLPADAQAQAGTHPITFIIREDKPDGYTLTTESSFLVAY